MEVFASRDYAPIIGVRIELTLKESNVLKYFLKHNLDTNHVSSLHELKDKLFDTLN